MRTSNNSFTVEIALLGFTSQQPSYGYEIYQQLSAKDGLWQVWRMKQSQLYALLTKLEEAAYLSTTVQIQDARPPRKIYTLTEAGRLVFDQWLISPVQHGRQMRVEFMAKLYFAARHDTQSVSALIDAQSALCRQWLREMDGDEADGDEIGGEKAGQEQENFFLTAVQLFRRSQIESFLTWLAQCREVQATLG